MEKNRGLLFAVSLFAIAAAALLGGYFKGLSASPWGQEKSHRVLVSIAPYKYFVEKIGGDTVVVDAVVPQGASAHSYEPTPKQVMLASKADAWFTLGESFESTAFEALRSQNPQMQRVDLQQNVSLIEEAHYHDGHLHSSADPHIWLSPKMAKVQVDTIARALMQLYPEYRQLYQARLEALIEELSNLDRQLEKEFKGLRNPQILVSHPAYSYMARDYGFGQYSIEFEGKEPSPKQLTALLQQARSKGIHTVFVQPQYNSKGAQLVAKSLGADVVMLNPYAYDYPENIRLIARYFAEANRP